MTNTKMHKGTAVLATEDQRGNRFVTPERAIVFEDYGTDYVSIRFDNGQIHAVPRASVTVAQ